MSKMTTHERFTRVFDFKEADRVGMWDFPWPGTIRRWHREGMPENTTYDEYFDVDVISRLRCDNTPQFPETIVEENDKFITKMTKWGGTERNFKNDDSTPDLISYSILNKDD